MIMITVMIRDMLELFTQYCCYCHFSLWLNGKISYLVARKVFLTSNQPSKEVSKKSIYIAYRRETSNALNASVCCEQNRLQRLLETVPAMLMSSSSRMLYAMRVLRAHGTCRVLSLSDCKYSLSPLSQTQID